MHQALKSEEQLDELTFLR